MPDNQIQYPIGFELASKRIFGHEGILSLDKNDPGNYANGVLKGTKYGISARAFPDLDIANLTIEQANAIYYKNYWVPLKCENYQKALGYQMMDGGFNHGIDRSSKFLQFALEVIPDGIIGPKTLAALSAKDPNDILFLYLAVRQEAMTTYSIWPSQSIGWMRRIAKNLRYCAEDNINVKI